ncbi:MAG: recombinase [Daejeonella sp.]|nr:recombinase [Daejeonella sp.]
MLVSPGTREEQARDLFMLSFYLCGMNAREIWGITTETAGKKRINYNWAKTRGRRKDNAYISIAIPPQAKLILQKYAGTLHQKYSAYISLDRALSFGMTKLALFQLKRAALGSQFNMILNRKCDIKSF